MWMTLADQRFLSLEHSGLVEQLAVTNPLMYRIRGCLYPDPVLDMHIADHAGMPIRQYTGLYTDAIRLGAKMVPDWTVDQIVQVKDRCHVRLKHRDGQVRDSMKLSKTPTLSLLHGIFQVRIREIWDRLGVIEKILKNPIDPS